MNAEALVYRWVELYNDGSPETYGSDQYLELYAPDCRWTESPTPLTPEGRRGNRAAIRAALEVGQVCFVDRHEELQELVVEGDRAAMWHTWSATVATDLGPDAPPLGARVTIDGATFLRVADGLIVEINEILSQPRW